MSAGAIAGLIAAGSFLILALVGCFVLFKLGRIFDEGTARVRQAGTTVDEVNQALAHVNTELERVDSIAANVQTITGNVSALTGLFAATLGGPVVKVAAFSYGVRRAAAKRSRGELQTAARERGSGSVQRKAVQ